MIKNLKHWQLNQRFFVLSKLSKVPPETLSRIPKGSSNPRLGNISLGRIWFYITMKCPTDFDRFQLFCKSLLQSQLFLPHLRFNYRWPGSHFRKHCMIPELSLSSNEMLCFFYFFSEQLTSTLFFLGSSVPNLYQYRSVPKTNMVMLYFPKVIPLNCGLQTLLKYRNNYFRNWWVVAEVGWESNVVARVQQLGRGMTISQDWRRFKLLHFRFEIKSFFIIIGCKN